MKHHDDHDDHDDHGAKATPQKRHHQPQHSHNHPQSHAPHTHTTTAGERRQHGLAQAEPLARGAGHGQVLYLDAGSGLAGDMLVAALLDLGVPETIVRDGLAGLDLSGYELKHRRVLRSGLSGRHFEVVVRGTQASRDYMSIVRLLEAARLSEGARQLALRAFDILARAEAQVHACPVEDVHFHEVGAVDSIVDITAAALAFDHLGANVVCSPLPLGRGTTHSQHGAIPLPAPATLLCLRGVPTYDAQLAAELVTPTGACLVAAAAHRFGGRPSMRPERVGLGAGTKDFPDRANVLRVVLGSPAPECEVGRKQGQHVVIEANIDDMTPELTAYALQRAIAAGALDAWTTPIGMKKGRTAITLSVLCRTSDLHQQAKLLFEETSTLGLRHYTVDRLERPRHVIRVETCYGPVDVKVAGGEGLDEHAAPEYESCRQAAQQHGVPIRKVYAAALRAFEAGRP